MHFGLLLEGRYPGAVNRPDCILRFASSYADTLFLNTDSISGSAMRLKYLAFVAVLGVLPAAPASGQEPDVPPQPTEGASCAQCGVIYDIKTITTEAPHAAEREPDQAQAPVGPFVKIPLTSNPNAQAEFGAYGSKEWRKQHEQTTYQVIVRFDDGRYTMIETDDASGLHLGQRVRVQQKRIEPLDGQ